MTFLKQGGNGSHKAGFVKPFQGNPIKLQSQPSQPVVGNTEQPLHMLLLPEPAATSAEPGASACGLGCRDHKASPGSRFKARDSDHINSIAPT